MRCQGLVAEDQPHFLPLSSCRSSYHLPNHRHRHAIDGIVIWKVEMFGDGEPPVLVPLVLIVTFHRAEVLAESVCEPTTSFSNVHCLTAGTIDCVNNTGRSAAVASFEVHNSVRVVDVGRPSGERTCSASGSLARKCSSLLLVGMWRKGAMDQDVSKAGIPPINAHGRGLEDIFCTRIISQDTKVPKQDLLDVLVLWMVAEYHAHLS